MSRTVSNFLLHGKKLFHKPVIWHLRTTTSINVFFISLLLKLHDFCLYFIDFWKEKWMRNARLHFLAPFTLYSLSTTWHHHTSWLVNLLFEQRPAFAQPRRTLLLTAKKSNLQQQILRNQSITLLPCQYLLAVHTSSHLIHFHKIAVLTDLAWYQNIQWISVLSPGVWFVQVGWYTAGKSRCHSKLCNRHVRLYYDNYIHWIHFQCSNRHHLSTHIGLAGEFIFYVDYS